MGVNKSGVNRSIDKDEKKKIDSKALIKLLSKALPYWPWFLLALVLVIIVAATTLVRPYLLGLALDDISFAISNPDNIQEYKDHIIRLGGGFLIIICIQFIVSYFNTIILNITSAKIVKDLRNKVFAHVQKLSFSYFDTTPVGSVVTRICNDTNAISEMYVNVLVNAFKDIFLMIGILIAMFLLNVKLTLTVLAVLPLMILAAVMFRKQARKIHKSIRARLTALNIFLSEHLGGMKVVQLFNMQRVKEKEFDKINNEYRKENNRRVVMFGIFRPFMEVTAALATALIFYVGGSTILEGGISFGIVYIFINYSSLFFQPIMRLTDMYNTTQASLVASDRIEVLFNTEVEKQPINPVNFEKVYGEIEFRNVWFAYIDDKWILKDVSFKVKEGEKIAIVGTTGAGKTTIINLILGFYKIQKGEILIDGININDIKIDQLRKAIGIVRQDVFLFKGDVKSNIRLLSDISDEEVIKAATTVNASKFIETLPNKYDEVVSQRGNTFSEGQKQLLSFARALVVDPKILVLDEATSNVDTNTEKLIQDGIENLMEGRTGITIAHRLSTIKNSDCILYIHKGRIAEQGTHNELLKQKGRYYNLYTIQFS